MKGLLIPGAITSGTYWFQGKVSAGLAQDRVTKMVLHSTETPPPNCPGYGGGVSAPTATIDPWNLVVWQHFPANVSAKALVDPTSTAVRENRDEVAQLEILGYTYPPAGREQWALSLIPDAGLALIARVLRWYADEGWGLPLRSTLPWKPYNAVRLSGPDYDAYTGVLGHMHVSGNDHTDPGGLNVARILTLATGGSTTQEEDDMTPEEHGWLKDLHAMMDAFKSGPEVDVFKPFWIDAAVKGFGSVLTSEGLTGAAVQSRIDQAVASIQASDDAFTDDQVNALAASLADQLEASLGPIDGVDPADVAQRVVDKMAERLGQGVSQ